MISVALLAALTCSALATKPASANPPYIWTLADANGSAATGKANWNPTALLLDAWRPGVEPRIYAFNSANHQLIRLEKDGSQLFFKPKIFSSCLTPCVRLIR